MEPWRAAALSRALALPLASKTPHCHACSFASTIHSTLPLQHGISSSTCSEQLEPQQFESIRLWPARWTVEEDVPQGARLRCIRLARVVTAAGCRPCLPGPPLTLHLEEWRTKNRFFADAAARRSVRAWMGAWSQESTRSNLTTDSRTAGYTVQTGLKPTRAWSSEAI